MSCCLLEDRAIKFVFFDSNGSGSLKTNKEMKFPKIIPYKELLIKRHLEHVAASRFTREQAIEIAKPYHLEQEVTDYIDIYGQSPDDALQYWDIYPFDI